MPATPRTPTPTAPSTAGTAAGLLEGLAARLEAAGFTARLATEPGRLPVLHVTSPAASRLAEQVCAAPREGRWWFWWSWAEPIAEGADEAAARIARVLAAAGGPGSP